MSSHLGRPEDSEYIAWIDLETTGNKDDDSIIEVGFVLTDRDLNEVEAKQLVVRPIHWEFLRSRMSDVVTEMHTKNGLLDDIERNFVPLPVEGADAFLSHLLRAYGKGNHIPLAGSGVAHFDRKYIRRELPKTDALLSYWAYDIGSVRRFLRWWDIPTPGSELRQAKTHRALDDTREHIAETRAIRDALQRHSEDAWKYWELNR